MAEVPEEATTVAYLSELMAAEEAGERSSVLIGPWSAFSVIMLLQLSLRHSEVPNNVKNGALHILGQLEPLFEGTYGEHLIAAGYDTARDV